MRPDQTSSDQYDRTVAARLLRALRTSNTARLALFMSADVMIVCASLIGAYVLVLTTGALAQDSVSVIISTLLIAALQVTTFMAAGLYRHVWRYVGVDTLITLTISLLFVGLLAVIVSLLSGGWGVLVHPVPVFGAAFALIGTAVLRGFGRIAVYAQSRATAAAATKVLIVGAGDAGSLLMRDLENQPELKLRVVGLVDDDPHKHGRVIQGVPVLGTTRSIPNLVSEKNVSQVFVALPSVTPVRLREILDLCAEAGARTRIVPRPLAKAETVHFTDLKSVEAEELLGRVPAHIDLAQVAASLVDQTVLVTGAAGSIGSELCRQVLKFGPRELIMIDIDESRLYETYLELVEEHGRRVTIRVCDIRNMVKLSTIFTETEPHVVFHAAAYKHVPVLESEPDEAVSVNVIGTNNVISACESVPGCQFVLISTDKAVNPASIMGATKAISEMLTILAAHGGMSATAVRFGNVLGSRGSVVPIFENQLRSGGPLQVTHPDATRYFMTITEAARLVLQAHALCETGTIYVLDMGAPVRILDLARKMIALSGSTAEIEFVGLRPAEKVHEQLVYERDGLVPSGAEHILKTYVSYPPIESLAEKLQALELAASQGHTDQIRELILDLVPAFAPQA